MQKARPSSKNVHIVLICATVGWTRVLLVTLFIVRQATTDCGFQFKNIPLSLSNTSNHKRWSQSVNLTTVGRLCNMETLRLKVYDYDKVSWFPISLLYNIKNLVTNIQAGLG